MIDNLSIKDVASYPKDKAVTIPINRKKVNLFYGLNGSGKSTLARYLQNLSNINYLHCSISPPPNQQDLIVYNQDFVESNFYEKPSQKGIFTIGEVDADAEKEVDNVLSDIETINTEITDVTELGSAKKNEADKLDDTLRKNIWEKKKHYEKHPLSFCIKSTANIGKRETFLKKVLSFSPNKDVDIDKLVTESEALIDENIQPQTNIEFIPEITCTAEQNPIFKEKIVGSSDSYLSQLIDELGNSDWVRNGLPYLNQDNCPFCQQGIDENFKLNINAVFSSVYEDKIEKINELYEEYVREVEEKHQYLQSDIFNQEHISKYEKLNTLILSYTTKLNENIKLIERKRLSPSEEITLIDTSTFLKELNSYIQTIRDNIELFNSKLSQKDALLNDIKKRFWQALRHECSPIIDAHNTAYQSIKNQRQKLSLELRDKIASLEASETTLSELRSRTTDIVTSVDNINKRLVSLGVRGISLKASDEDAALYYIKRENHSDEIIFKSLSEGEKTLITFLYFLETCQGSTTKDGNAISSNRTIVIDDPISSLSQNYVFDIASIIHHEILEKDFKQVFVLTHNLYFFHELLMLKNPNKNHEIKGYNLFRVVKSDFTNIVPMERSSLLNDYQNYWKIIKDCSENKQHVSMLPNAMRNILERYFGFIHQKHQLKKALEKIGANDKEFEPFLRYFNRESHADAINLDLGTIDAQRYISKFKEIFTETGFPEHFTIMME